jgi:hypothetical protein
LAWFLNEILCLTWSNLTAEGLLGELHVVFTYHIHSMPNFILVQVGVPNVVQRTSLLLRQIPTLVMGIPKNCEPKWALAALQSFILFLRMLGSFLMRNIQMWCFGCFFGHVL